jgi:acetyl-CoA carboxylase biotin carboxylase subunit
VADEHVGSGGTVARTFNKVMVANRGAVAARVLRALNEMGIRTVAVYSDADRHAPWLEWSSEAHHIGLAPARDSYLNQDTLIALLKRTGADGVHPGYGFLAENAGFARRITDMDAIFIGPSARWIEDMGHKTRARALAKDYGLPVGPGTDVLSGGTDAIVAAARRIGYPLLVKPAGGGGGIGMLTAHNETELVAAVEKSASLAQRSFANAEVYLERLVEKPRHVELQIIADNYGNCTHLFERDCSVQRRHQKVIEEAPGPGIPRTTVDTLGADIAEKLGAAGYNNIGTVEMLMDRDGAFSFLEMNTRLQVEHGVTEEVTGIDIVKSQVRLAAGEKLADVMPKPPALDGHAIEARVYAEDPRRFFPSPGKLETFRPPVSAGVRVETGYREGLDVTPHYDPLLAKVIVKRPTRDKAIDDLIEALGAFEVRGVKSNIPALVTILGSDQFRSGNVHTGVIGELIK